MARYEKIVNYIATALNGAVNDTVTSITVSDSSGWPAEGDYRVRIDSEVVLVTANAANVLTVVRGVDGTTAVSHTDGTALDPILTATGIAAYFDHVTVGASARQPARLLDDAGVVLTSTDFTWANQGLAYVDDDSDGSITLGSDNTATSGNSVHVLYKSAPTPPYTLTAAIIVGMGWDWDGPGSSTFGGLTFRENSTGEMLSLTNSTNTPASSGGYQVFRWSSPTSISTAPAGTLPQYSNTTHWWAQIEDDNANLFFRCSHDGLNWFELVAPSRTAWMAGGPDEIGFIMSQRAQGTAGNKTAKHEMTIKSWIEE